MAGRPRSFDRDEALGKAVEAFWRDGYESTSVAALTGAMGISPPSLYAAFGDKEALFDEAAGAYVANFRAGTDEALARPTAREAIERLLQVTARAHTDTATPRGCLVLTEPRLKSERAWLRRRIARRIAAGIEAGDVPADADPKRLAAFLESVLSGMSARARDGATLAELTATGEVALAAIPSARARPAPAQRSPRPSPSSMKRTPSPLTSRGAH
jgi:AcrR family transcriptional regulator